MKMRERKKTMRSSGFMFALLLVTVTVLYGFFQARTLIDGPRLTVSSPEPGRTVSGETLLVSGHTQNVTHVYINGAPATMDVSGNYEKTLVTPDGYGVILVEAENRFGRHIEERVEFFGVPEYSS